MNSLRQSTLFKTSTITDGNMSFRFGEPEEVVENRRHFLERNGIGYKDCVPMSCNHGEIIAGVNRTRNASWYGPTTPEQTVSAEVLVTNEPDTTLLLLTADCLPVAFYDPVQKTIALAHLNRKTIAHNLGKKTVKILVEHYNADPKNLLVAIGPHIKKESYRFPLPLTEPTPAQLLDYITTEAGAISIDLVSAEVAQLTALGVERKKISVSKVDTATSPKHFSHYRSGRDPHHPEGRMASILKMQ